MWHSFKSTSSHRNMQCSGAAAPHPGGQGRSSTAVTHMASSFPSCLTAAGAGARAGEERTAREKGESVESLRSAGITVH